VVRGATVDVYASLPLRGVWAGQGAAIADGIKLALAQAGGVAGPWRIHLILLDDSGGAARVAHDARTAGTDPRAVYYIGELDSGASQISAPLLNEAGVPQVSPLSTSVAVGSAAFDPTGRPTFFRLAPSDAVQAVAQLGELAHARCKRVALVHDGTLEGMGLAAALSARRGAIAHSFAVAGSAAPGLAARIKAQGDDCAVFAGAPSPSAVAALSELVGGRLRLVLGSYGVCTASVTRALPVAARAAFRCTAPTGNLNGSTVSRAFVATYQASFGDAAPDPVAVYGYEAMRLALDTVAQVGPRGDDKSAVRAALLALRGRRSVLGTYEFDRSGASDLRTYGLYRIGAAGEPVFAGALRT
jgi:branched-chain amino acid transport system substrate-binding protein